MIKNLKYNSDLIKSKARETGFSACGIAPIHSLESERVAIESWLSKGMHGSMDFMERNLEKRLNPAELVEGAKSVIIVFVNYYSPLKQTDPEAPVISKYAYGKDYHVAIKDKLQQLLKFIDKEIAPCKGRAFVDSAPVLEKAWAKEAGLGWIGKHSLLITKEYGSFVFIGELIIDLELDYNNEKEADYCGTCNRCIEACPTGAIVSERVIDVRKCIAYHTIENKDECPPEVRSKLNNRIFGCDICQDACPWNKEKKETEIQEFKPLKSLLEMDWQAWHLLDQTTFDRMFHNTAIKRAGYNKLKQNIGYTEQKEAIDN
jgi:epoxyqueuosine reductase